MPLRWAGTARRPARHGVAGRRRPARRAALPKRPEPAAQRRVPPPPPPATTTAAAVHFGADQPPCAVRVAVFCSRAPSPASFSVPVHPVDLRPNHCANDITQVQGERHPRRLKPRRHRCGDPLHPLQVRPPTFFVDSSLPGEFRRKSSFMKHPFLADRRLEEAVAFAPPFSTAAGSLHASSSSPKLRQRTHDL
ncbi:hypothetical protein OsI_30577 [Oryza sativa Indica Group]|uniref:Uncharacterized protein n=1 Tax=Oryza sativa subsp. indica TaxID=39946 RepID=B8BDF5_ORYSI|nr:hypothetical protein OsI_30577 [Oryza sativa Indica Group]